MSESNSVSADIDTRAIPHWYLIQCKGGESFRATENLANQGYEIFHPVLQVQKKRRGRLCWIDEPLFPYYLFPARSAGQQLAADPLDPGRAASGDVRRSAAAGR